MRFAHLLAAAALIAVGPVAAQAADADWGAVAAALGKSGAEMPGGVYRVGMPRTDLQVTLEGVQIKPTLHSAPGWRSSARARTAWSWATSS